MMMRCGWWSLFDLQINSYIHVDENLKLVLCSKFLEPRSPVSSPISFAFCVWPSNLIGKELGWVNMFLPGETFDWLSDIKSETRAVKIIVGGHNFTVPLDHAIFLVGSSPASSSKRAATPTVTSSADVIHSGGWFHSIFISRSCFAILFLSRGDNWES